MIAFMNEKIEISYVPDKTILALMREIGLAPDAPCGGHGRCKKCRVRIRMCADEEWKEVLACQTKAEDGMQIDTLLAESTAGENTAHILTTGTSHAGEYDPIIRQIKVLVPPCPPGKSISDWTRFEESLCTMSKSSEVIKYRPDPWIVSRIGRIVSETKGTVYAVVCEDEVLHVAAQEVPCYMAAFDIGTTTIAGFLLDAKDGKEVAVASRMNPQTQYGADVINRANYTLEHGMREVTDCVRTCINEMLEELADKAHTAVENIYAISIVGNTCMHHLFLGIDVNSLVHAPYNPAVEEAMILPAHGYGIHAAKKARLLMLPNIAGFVGADTVGCLVASDLDQQKDWTLLVDIGTNGEMVLGKQGAMAACSTAAGPAFEGAGIRYGMRGAEGAISKVKWNGTSWDISVIGGGLAKGICGSGLLDTAAQLLVNGLMSESGMLEDGPEVVLADAEHSVNREPVLLVQKDISELQLAKAAIASGIYLLAQKMGIRTDQIQNVWLAGAFGSFMSPESACAIGMIPQELLGRIEAIGNAAGEGAKRILREKTYWKKAQKLAKDTDFLELAGMPQFQDQFVEELMFPEQDD